MNVLGVVPQPERQPVGSRLSMGWSNTAVSVALPSVHRARVLCGSPASAHRPDEYPTDADDVRPPASIERVFTPSADYSLVFGCGLGGRVDLVVGVLFPQYLLVELAGGRLGHGVDVDDVVGEPPLGVVRRE